MTSEVLPTSLQPTSVVRVPPLLEGTATPEIRTRVERFYQAIEQIFESWVNRSESAHTRRAYRDDVMAFVRFLGFAWPEEAPALLGVSVLDVQRFREALVELGAANKTLNRRICSLSAFYKYLGLSAAELRLPINLPNPASAQFVKRAKADARKETKALSLAAGPPIARLTTRTRRAGGARSRGFEFLLVFRSAHRGRLQTDRGRLPL